MQEKGPANAGLFFYPATLEPDRFESIAMLALDLALLATSSSVKYLSLVYSVHSI
jgi:hypothetical protein